MFLGIEQIMRIAAGNVAGLEAEADVFGLTHVEASQC